MVVGQSVWFSVPASCTFCGSLFFVFSVSPSRYSLIMLLGPYSSDTLMIEASTAKTCWTFSTEMILDPVGGAASGALSMARRNFAYFLSAYFFLAPSKSPWSACLNRNGKT